MVRSLVDMCIFNAMKYSIDIDKTLTYPPKVYKKILALDIAGCLESQFLKRFNTYTKENILLSGSVQSGKTHELLCYCWWSIYITNRHVIFLTRNIKSDILQLRERIDMFNTSIVKDERFFIKDERITIILANNYQIDKVYKIIKDRKYNLCIDECDLCIKSFDNSSKMETSFKDLKANAKHIVGATATGFATLALDKTISSVFKLENPLNYYSINDINIKIVDGSSRKIFLDIYSHLMKKSNFFILHNVSRYTVDHDIIALAINNMFPEIVTIIFNWKGTVVKINADEYRYTRSVPLSRILQSLKKYKYISIISGDLASRGLSFVSDDFKLHLTDQYFDPSLFTHGEKLIQGLRILGKYNDLPKLTLWCSDTTHKRIIEQYKNLNTYIDSRVSNKDIDRVYIDIPSVNFSRINVMSGLNKELNREGKIRYMTKIHDKDI